MSWIIVDVMSVRGIWSLLLAEAKVVGRCTTCFAAHYLPCFLFPHGRFSKSLALLYCLLYACKKSGPARSEVVVDPAEIVCHVDRAAHSSVRFPCVLVHSLSPG